MGRAALLRAGGPFPASPFGTSLSPLGSHQVLGAVSVPLGQGDGCSRAVPHGNAMPVAHTALCAVPCSVQLCPAPRFGVNKHKTKLKSCQFWAPSPCILISWPVPVAPDVRCENNQSQVGVSPSSQQTPVGNSRSGSWSLFSRRLWNVSGGYSHAAPGLMLDNAT